MGLVYEVRSHFQGKQNETKITYIYIVRETGPSVAHVAHGPYSSRACAEAGGREGLSTRCGL